MRSICAALAVIALLALAGCGGSSSSKPKTVATATTATTPGKPDRLPQTDVDRLDRAAKAIVSATPLLLSALNRCVPRKQGRSACVKRAARPAEAAVSRSRGTFNRLLERTGGACSALIEAARDRLAGLTEDLRAVTVAAQAADVGGFTKVGATVQGDLRVFAQASQMAQTTCNT